MSKRPSSFFGRLDFSEKLFDRVLKQNLVAVIGRSGSGKSSVAQAGLLPLLRRQTPPADTWESILFTRGSKPFHRLAARLVPLCSPPGRDLTDIATESEKLATRLASDEVTLASFIDLALKNLPDTTRLIAIVDQFEELFTQTPQEGLRKRFVEELLAASRESNLTVVLTLRADFFGQAIKLRGLSDAIETGLVNVSEMTRAELKEAIEEPARLTGLQFEVGLVDRILDQVEQQPGSLPLLQYALTELWQRRQDGQLTHVAYDAIGGVEGAISKRAEAQFAKLTRAQQKVALPALARLVRVSSPSEEGTDTRQVFRLRELDPDAQAVMLTFAAKEARLVVTGCDETTNAGTVEVAHEALIRSWGELKQWIDKDREFLLWRQQLRPFLDKWRGLAQGKDSALLHGVYLAEARHWLQSRANDLSNEERQFIEASERPIIKSRRWKQVSAAAALTVALAVVGWVWWTRTDSYQVRIVLSQGSALVPSSGCESVADWVRALFYAGRYTQALATIRQVGSPGWRACALSALARALADKGKKEEASRVAAEAVSAVGQKKLNKDYSAYATACALAQGGLTGDVMAVIHQLEDEGQRAAKLVNAVHAAVQSGKTEEALALAAAPEIDGYRVWALSAVAQALARIGRMEEADRLARKAQAVAEEQLSVYGANEAGLLVEAAQALAKVGRTAEANNLAQRAMAMAPQISSERVRNQMAYGVAVLLARQGKVQEAKAIIHGQSTDGSGEATLFALELAEAGHVSEAIATSRETNDETALRRVAKVLARAAKVKEALTSARQLKDPGDRVEALSAAAQAAEAGKIGEASTIAKESLGYARRVTDDYQRSSALSQVAGAFAQLHSYREARLIADRDTSSSDKLSAYAAILREYTVQHHPELGRFF